MSTMKCLFISLSLCILTTSVRFLESKEMPYCPTTGTERFFHPRCCNLYYECTDGTATLKECEADEVYDPNEKACGAVSDTLKCETNVCGKDAPSCPSSDDPSRISVELCCNLYYQCTDNVATLTECPVGEVYDSKSTICVTETSLSCIRNICELDEMPVCPATGTERFFHPKCCNLYYGCTDGTATLEVCAADEVYNPVQKVCGAVSETLKCKTNVCGENELPICSSQYFPNPGNCKSYYHCDNGIPRQRPCGIGTAWNKDINVCDHIRNVNCTDF